MICKHCNEEIVVNPVRRSPEPFVYFPFKHKTGNLLHCFQPDGTIMAFTAEPKESK